MKSKTYTLSAIALVATLALAGPPLGCVQFDAAPGSLFEKVAPLARVMIESDDNPASGKIAFDRIASLRAKALAAPKDRIAQLEAGYLIQAINQMSAKKDHDGLKFLNQALALDPNDAEMHLIMALAYKGEDESKVKSHLAEMRRLTKPGSAAMKNFERAREKLGVN